MNLHGTDGTAGRSPGHGPGRRWTGALIGLQLAALVGLTQGCAAMSARGEAAHATTEETPATPPIVREVELAAMPEQVFDAFTDPSALEAWFAMTVEADLRPGGRWRMTWPPTLAAEGRYLTVNRPSHLVWTWEKSMQDHTKGLQPGEEHPVVTIDYTFERTDAGTRLRLVESGHGSEKVRAMNETGIETMISMLQAYLAGELKIDWSAPPPEH